MLIIVVLLLVLVLLYQRLFISELLCYVTGTPRQLFSWERASTIPAFYLNSSFLFAFVRNLHCLPQTLPNLRGSRTLDPRWSKLSSAEFYLALFPLTLVTINFYQSFCKSSQFNVKGSRDQDVVQNTVPSQLLI